MPKDTVKFPLSTQTDVEFQKALAIVKAMPQGWHVVGIRRDTVVQDGVQVPVGVIDVEL